MISSNNLLLYVGLREVSSTIKTHRELPELHFTSFFIQSTFFLP
uniref:Uncharacterized protein n=1 Tax=Anguilla anguilla TaxID=7936 RepID=A0A0E9SF84_ANGAN